MARPPGEIDEFGLPVRADWAADYRGKTTVVYGHTPVLRGRVGQQHAVHRHRLRLRRQADGAALAGEGDGRACRRRRSGASRRARSAPGRQPRSAQAECRRPARHGGRQRPALDRHRAARPHRGGGGERRRRARGDEPLRAGAAMAGLSAADHVALGDQRARRLAGAARGGVRRISASAAWPRWCARKSTWARAP